METKNITLKVNSSIYDKYREYCKRKGLIVSKLVSFIGFIVSLIVAVAVAILVLIFTGKLEEMQYITEAVSTIIPKG